MIDSGQNWELFGYDMRNLGRHWMAAWRDFLWSYDSPVRMHLDEPVRLHLADTSEIYQGGQPSQVADTQCEAILLPDDKILSRILRFPVEVESDLDAVIALEVNANSPFTADDTGSGWRIVKRTEQQLSVALVIVSMSAAMAYVAQHHNSHDASAQEVWVQIDGHMVVIKGFGEVKREGLYKRRLIKVAATILLAALVPLLIGGVGAGFKRIELKQVEALAETTQKDSAEASRMRTALNQGNEIIAAVDALRLGYPPVHPELARLTELLADDAFLERLGITGREIDIRGRAGNAAALMQLLTEQDLYEEVIAASPIRRLPSSDVEQFHLKIKLRGGEV